MINDSTSFNHQLHWLLVGISWDIPCGNESQFANWNMAIETLSFPMNSMVIFHSHVSLPEGRDYVKFSNTQQQGLYVKFQA